MIRCPKCTETFRFGNAQKAAAPPLRSRRPPRTATSLQRRGQGCRRPPAQRADEAPRPRRRETDSDPDLETPCRRPEKGGNKTLMWSLIGGGGLLLVVGLILVLANLGGGSDEKKTAELPPNIPPPPGQINPPIQPPDGGNGNPPINPNPNPPPPVEPPPPRQPRDVQAKKDPIDDEDPGPRTPPPELPAVANRPFLALDAGGHIGMFRNAYFTPDGKQIVTVGLDKTVRVWDATTGETLRIFPFPVGPGDEGILQAGRPVSRRQATGGQRRPHREEPRRDLPDGSEHRANDPRAQGAPGQREFAGVLEGRQMAGVGRLRRHGDRVRRPHRTAERPAECAERADHLRGLLAGQPDAGDGLQERASPRLEPGQRAAVPRPAGTTSCSTPASPPTAAPSSPAGPTAPSAPGAWTASPPDVQGHRRPQRAHPDRLPHPDEGRHGGGCTPGSATAARPAWWTWPPASTASPSRSTPTPSCGCLSPDGKLAFTSGGNDNECSVWKTADGAIVHKIVGKGKAVWAVGWSRDGKPSPGATPTAATDGSSPWSAPSAWTALDFGPAPTRNYGRPAATRDRAWTATTTRWRRDFYTHRVKHNGQRCGRAPVAQAATASTVSRCCPTASAPSSARRSACT